MVGSSIYRLIPPELHDSETDILRRVSRGEPVEFAEVERVRKDGQRIHIALSVSPIRDGSGKVVGAASVKRDITEQKRIQAALEAKAPAAESWPRHWRWPRRWFGSWTGGSRTGAVALPSCTGLLPPRPLAGSRTSCCRPSSPCRRRRSGALCRRRAAGKASWSMWPKTDAGST